MKILHAYWKNDSKNPLHLWIEKPADECRHSVKGQSKKTFSQQCPVALNSVILPEFLSPIIKEIKIHSSLTQVELSLPINENKIIHSSEIHSFANVKNVKYQKYSVSMVNFHQRDIDQVMNEASRMNELEKAPDFLFLQELIKITHRTIRAGRCLPMLIKDDESMPVSFSSKWVFEKEHLHQCIEKSLPFFPGLFLLDRQGQGSPKDWIEKIFNDLLDGLIRIKLAGQFSWSDLEEKQSQNWLFSLTHKHGLLEGGERDWQLLQTTLDDASSLPKEDKYRLIFNLREPKKESESWVLEFLIQDYYRVGPPRSCKELWTDASSNFIVKELTRAALIFPKILNALKNLKPNALNLSNREAYLFLTEGALKLQSQGFSVTLPKWWTVKKNRAKAILKIKPVSEIKMGSGMGALLDYEWQVQLGPQRLSLKEFQKIITKQSPLIKQGDEWVEIRLREIENAFLYFDQKLHNKREPMALSKALQMGLQGEMSELGLPVAKVEAEGWVKSFIEFLFSEESFDLVDIPTTFKGFLRPYQHRGVSWLAFLQKRGFGSCLADDMGLGKTIEFIAFILYERRSTARIKPEDPDLLICPMSIVSNWQHELEKFSPHLKVCVHHGHKRAKGIAFQEKIKNVDLVITTYQLALKDQDCFGKQIWNRVTLDEAQNIKNETAKQTLAIKKIHSKFKVALTGTPIENRLSELWSIMDFLNPGYLGSIHLFKTKYQKPVEKRGDDKTLEKLHQLVRPFLLRRLKTDRSIIQDLPEKIETKEYCDLTRLQRRHYQEALDELFGGVEKSTGIQRRGLVLGMLTKLKQICNHPSNYLKLEDAHADDSGKAVRMIELLKDIDEYKEKTLIFTQYVEMGNLLKNMIVDELAIPVFFLHGGLSKSDREHEIDAFKKVAQQSAVFILSTKAGGVGLNLTEANHVIHYDRWWNPAVENQATDRAFRIGQKKNVQVHKFICAKTFEEKIDQIIERKMDLQKKAITTGEGFLTEISNEELREILKLEDD